MDFPELVDARLIKRYKRFLADVELPDGQQMTVFVANTGSLLGCVEPGSRAWLRPLGGGGKHSHSLLLVETEGTLVCVDTSLPNRIVIEAAREQLIPQLAGYLEYIREMPLGESSRADLCCRAHKNDLLRRCWVEIKATTLRRGSCAQFPDAVTLRGRKHLTELAERVRAGGRAAQVFFLQRGDCDRFSPAADVDPGYAEELGRAAAAGVEIIALCPEITKRGIRIDRQLPIEL